MAVSFQRTFGIAPHFGAFGCAPVSTEKGIISCHRCLPHPPVADEQQPHTPPTSFCLDSFSFLPSICACMTSGLNSSIHALRAAGVATAADGGSPSSAAPAMGGEAPSEPPADAPSVPRDFEAFVAQALDFGSDPDEDDDGTSVPANEYGFDCGSEGQIPGRASTATAMENDQDGNVDTEGSYPPWDDEEYHRGPSEGGSEMPRSPGSQGASPFISPQDEELVSNEPSVNSYHGWPLFAALAPPVLTVFGGQADHWSNAVEILLASFWLYQFLRSPWELYDSARSRRVIHADQLAYAHASKHASVVTAEARKAQIAHVAQQEQHQASLQRAELLAFLWCVCSPLVGAITLVWLRDTLSDGGKYINAFSIRLFVVTAGIKPWMHAVRLARRRLLFLQKEVYYPAGKMEILADRVAGLETELARLRAGAVTRAEMDVLHEALDTPLAHVVKAVRKASRREAKALAVSAGDMARVDGQLAALAEETESTTAQIQQDRQERERWMALPGTLLQAVGTTLGQKYKGLGRPKARAKVLDQPAPTQPDVVQAGGPSRFVPTHVYENTHAVASEPSSTPRPHNKHRRLHSPSVRHHRSSTWSADSPAATYDSSGAATGTQKRSHSRRSSRSSAPATGTSAGTMPVK